MATTKAASTKTKARKKPVKKVSAKKTAPVSIPDSIFVEQTPEQKQAKLNAYVTLKSAGVPIPSELAIEVEAIVAASQKIEEDKRQAQEAAITTEQKAIDAANEKGPKWIRNGYNTETNVRLDRQDKSKGQRRIELKPRGQRGDMFQIKEEDLQDPTLMDSIERGIVHVIGDGDAKTILSKQTHNMNRTHTPLALLRNEQGEPYAPGAIKVEAEFNSQGVVVAQLDPSIGAQQENMNWKTGQKSGQGGLIRTGQTGTVEQFIPTPPGGNAAIISSGFAGADKEAKARISDDIARRKKVQGRPEDVLGGLAVTVEPTRRG